jgi:hypothetical protein
MTRYANLLRWACRKLGRPLTASGSRFWSHRSAPLYDIGKTYWIDPERVKLAQDFRVIDRLDSNQQPGTLAHPLPGLIVGGNWDLEETIPLQEMHVWKAFQQRHVEHAPWEETAFYQLILSSINGGHALWKCTTREHLDARVRQIDLLFDEIRKNGYRTQDKLKSFPRSFGDDDEVHVHIGRHGDYILADGWQRLCIAKILKLDKVPVRVARRHSEWVELRRRILTYAAKQKLGKLYAPVLHPDLADMPAVHGRERMDIIRQHVKARSGRMLDIGAHWGYFCHCFEDLGFECTAVEADAENLYFLQKLRRADNKSFGVVKGSVLELDCAERFEVVLALNIFHHFLKEEASFNQLIGLLKRLKTNVMFFEAHLPIESQMRGSFRNYAPDDFVDFVMRHGGFRSACQMGVAADGRLLFKLES